VISGQKYPPNCIAGHWALIAVFDQWPHFYGVTVSVIVGAVAVSGFAPPVLALTVTV